MADDTQDNNVTENEPGYKGDSIVTHAPEQTPVPQPVAEDNDPNKDMADFLKAGRHQDEETGMRDFLTDKSLPKPAQQFRGNFWAFHQYIPLMANVMQNSPIGTALRFTGNLLVPNDEDLPANKATQEAIKNVKNGFDEYQKNEKGIDAGYTYGQMGPQANDMWQKSKLANDIAKIQTDLHPEPTFGEAVNSIADNFGLSLRRQLSALDQMLANVQYDIADIANPNASDFKNQRAKEIEAQNAEIKQDTQEEQYNDLSDRYRSWWRRDLYNLSNAFTRMLPMMAGAATSGGSTAAVGAGIFAFQSTMDRAANAIAQGKTVDQEFKQAGVGSVTGYLYSLMPMSILSKGFGAAALRNTLMTVAGSAGMTLTDKMIDIANQNPDMKMTDVVSKAVEGTTLQEAHDTIVQAIGLGLAAETFHATPKLVHSAVETGLHAAAGQMTEEHYAGLASIDKSFQQDPLAMHNAVVAEGSFLPDEARPTEAQQKILDQAAQKLPRPEAPDERTAEDHARGIDPEAFRIRDNLEARRRTRQTWLDRDYAVWHDSVERQSPYYAELERLLARMEDPDVAPMKRAQARKRAEETVVKHDDWVSENTRDVPPHIQEHIEELDNLKRQQIELARTNRIMMAFQAGERRAQAARGEKETPVVSTEPLTVEKPEPAAITALVPRSGQKPLADQRQSMIDKATKALTDAGYPAEYAGEYARIAADRYLNLATGFGGKLGSPEELFDKEFPTIAANTPKPGKTAKKGVVAVMQDTANKAIRSLYQRTLGHKEGTLYANLSAVTQDIPAINDLREAAMAGDAQAADMLRQMAKNTMERLLSGVQSAKVETDGKTGLYGGEVEPSLGAKITFAERDREQVVKALVRTAQLYKQREVHVRGDATGKVGKVHRDGSFNTVVYRFTIPREFTREEIQKIIDESGLKGLTFDGKTMETYHVGQPGDDAEFERFERNIERALATAQELGGKGVSVEQSLERLWRYGKGRGTIPYREVQGELRTPTPGANENARLVIARHLGEEPSLGQPKKVTKEQATLQRLIAHAYELMPDNDMAENANTRKAYEHLKRVVLQQLKTMPIEFEAWKGKDEPYKATEDESASDQMRRDVEDNHHMWYYPTGEGTFGPEGVDFSGHPLLEKTGVKDKSGRELLVNDALRIVHDYYAHTPTVAQFGPIGEEAAWRNHMASISDPWARWALTSETRGQNSWVNFRPEIYGQGIPVKMRGFARQKAALLPIEFAMTGDEKVDAPMRELAKSLSADERSGSIDEKDMVKAENLPEPGKPPLTEQRVKWDLTPDEHAITENDILNGERIAKTGTVLVRDIAKQLMDRGIAARKKAGYPAVIEGPNLKTDSLLSRLIASMTKNALLKGEQEGGRTAIDWYKKSVEECMRVVRMMHPEMKDDPHAEMIYRLGLAITSQGEKVPSNFRLAEMVYDRYRQDGKFPEDIKAKEQNSMNENFNKLNTLIEESGGDLEKLKEFLHSEHTVRDLEAKGWAPEGSKDDKVYGSAILGAKIGQGFYQNLSGNLKPLTVDMWFMRTWGRITGTLVGNDLTKPAARFEKALQDEGHDVPKTPRGLLKRAQEIIAVHEKHYKANAADYRSKNNPEGKFVKSELTKAAEAYEHNSIGINEGLTSAGQRKWIKKVVEQARRQLAAEGIHLENAQLQAIIWYPEKSLYDKMGGDPEITNNVDYSQSAQEFARKKGHSEDDIKAALLGSDERGSERPAAGVQPGDVPPVREEPVRPERSGGEGFKSAIESLQQEEVSAPARAQKQGPKGMIDLIQPGLTRARMTLITGRADASTFIHEIGHQWLDETMRYSQHPDAPEWLKKDAATIKQWLQVESGTSGKGKWNGLTTTQHEIWARVIERFFYEGTAPTQAMVPVFQRFKQWFRKIYSSVSDIYAGKYRIFNREKVPTEIQDVIARMLTGADTKAVVASQDSIGSEFSKMHAAEEKFTPPALAGHVADMQESEIDAIHKKHHEAGHAKVKEAENRTGKAGGVTAPSGGAQGTGLTGTPAGRSGDVQQPPAVPAVGGQAPGESGQARAGAAGSVPAAGSRPADAPSTGRGSPGNDAKPDTSAKRGPWDREKYDLGNMQSKNMNSGQFNDWHDVQQFMIDTYRQDPTQFGNHDVVSDEELMRTAQAAGLPQEEFAMQRIRSLSNENGVPMAAYVRIAIKMFGDKAKIAKDAALLAQRTGKEEDIAKFMEARGEFLLVAKTLSKGANEIGRSLRAFRDMSKAASGQAMQLSHLFQEMDGLNDAQRKKMIEQAALLQNDGQIAKFMQDSQKKSFGQNIVAYRINALISGPLTHARYAVGNLINAIYEPLVKTPVAAAIGAARAAIGQDVKDRVYFGEAVAQIGAMTKGSADGWRAAVQAWRDYQSPALPGERAMLNGHSKPADIGELRRRLEDPGVTDEEKSEIRKQIAQSIYDKFVSQPSRSVSAIHSFFKSLRYEQNIQKLAYRQAMREGLEGAARDTRIAELTMSPTEDMMAFAQMKDPMAAVAEHFAINTGRSVQDLLQNPTQEMKDFAARTMMVKEATADALKQLYMAPTKYDSIMGRAIAWSNASPFIKCLIPFMKIGTQIETLAMIEGTPLAFANEEYRNALQYKEGGARGDEQWSAMAIGMSMMGVGFYLASQGDITGDGPVDAAQRRVWLLTHSPNTINIGGMRVSYKGLGYLGIQLRVMANLYETAHYHTVDDIASYSMELLGAMGKTVLDDNWMKGAKDFLDMLYGDEEERERWAKQAVSNMLPYSIGLSQTAHAIDPYYRQADGIVQSILNNVPFASETLSPKYDVFGNPIRRDGPMYVNDVTAQTLEHIGVGVSQVPKTIHGIPLSAQQRDDFQQHGGFMVKKYLDNLISQPGFSQLAPGDQVSEIKRLIAKGHKAGRDFVMMKYRDELYPQILANKRTYLQTGKKVKAQ